MSNTQEISSAQPMGIGLAVLYYCAALALLAAVVAMTVVFEGLFGSLLVLTYVGLGIVLNRAVLRRLVVWHPMQNTLLNVAKAKLGMALLWPVRYPVLFAHLLVDKHL